MARAELKAGFFTVLLFGVGLWFLFGKPGLEDMKGLIPDFKTETTKTTTKKKGSKSSSGTAAGKVIDQYNGVKVYYNGNVGNVSGRNLAKDGYNLGLKYQCVEFSKRYYYERFGHKMPDSYGHAKDFYNASVADGAMNKARGMIQYKNGGSRRPLKEDLIVIGPTPENSFGHLVVVTDSSPSEVSFIQQNPGRNNPSRGSYRLSQRNGGWYVDGRAVLGWLRMP